MYSSENWSETKVALDIRKAGMNKQCKTHANDKDMAILSEIVCENFT